MYALNLPNPPLPPDPPNPPPFAVTTSANSPNALTSESIPNSTNSPPALDLPHPNTTTNYRDKLIGSSTGAFESCLLSPTDIDSTPEPIECNKYGIPIVRFTAEEKAILRAPFKQAIIVIVFGKTVGFHYLFERVTSLWKPAGQIKCIDLGHDFFIIKFSLEKDLAYVLKEGPWFIGSHFLTIRMWEPNFNAAKATFSSVALWIKLPSLPVEYFNVNSLKKIGSSIGPVLRVDEITVAGDRGKYARLCVQVNVNKPLIPQVQVDEDHIQDIVYEGISKLCFNCGKIGHVLESCLELQPSPTTVQPPTVVHLEQQQSERESNQDSNLNESFGPWMLVTRRNKRKNRYATNKKLQHPNSMKKESLVKSQAPIQDSQLSLRGKANFSLAKAVNAMKSNPLASKWVEKSLHQQKVVAVPPVKTSTHSNIQNQSASSPPSSSSDELAISDSPHLQPQALPTPSSSPLQIRNEASEVNPMPLTPSPEGHQQGRKEYSSKDLDKGSHQQRSSQVGGSLSIDGIPSPPPTRISSPNSSQGGISLQREPILDRSPSPSTSDWQLVTKKKGKKSINTSLARENRFNGKDTQLQMREEINEPASKIFNSDSGVKDKPIQQPSKDNSIEEAIKRLSNLPLLDIRTEKICNTRGNTAIRFRHVLAKARRGVKLSPQGFPLKKNKQDKSSMGDDSIFDLDVNHLLSGDLLT